jgi:hypothetical protein
MQKREPEEYEWRLRNYFVAKEYPYGQYIFVEKDGKMNWNMGTIGQMVDDVIDRFPLEEGETTEGPYYLAKIKIEIQRKSRKKMKRDTK